MLAALAAGAAYGWREYDRRQGPPPIEYKAAAPTRGDLTQSVTASGFINPVKNVEVGSQVSGIVQDLYADFNSTVTNGQVIARAEIDSCAVLFEPTLRAWGLPYDFLHDDGDGPKIRATFNRAQQEEQPVALLITRDTT